MNSNAVEIGRPSLEIPLIFSIGAAATCVVASLFAAPAPAVEFAIGTSSRCRGTLGPDESRAVLERLYAEWQEGTAFTSSITQIVLHPAYQNIIGMGFDAVPFILDKLKTGPDHWGHALRAITRQDPVPPTAAGDLEAIANTWLLWGREHGYA